MLRGLDRDFPEGQAEYSFTVYAEDARSRDRLGSANVFVILKGGTTTQMPVSPGILCKLLELLFTYVLYIYFHPILIPSLSRPERQLAVLLATSVLWQCDRELASGHGHPVEHACTRLRRSSRRQQCPNHLLDRTEPGQ